MATILSGVGASPRNSGGGLAGPVLPLKDLAALQRAPKRRAGTQVTARSYDIPWLPGKAEHMYLEYDDGRDQLIGRGGPSHLSGAVDGSLRVVGGVTPARQSRDYGKGGRVVQSGFVPDMTAQQASASARALGDRLAADPRAYSYRSNSNSFAADAFEGLFGVRPGDHLTPGHDRRLDASRRVRPRDFSPAMAARPGA